MNKGLPTKLVMKVKYKNGIRTANEYSPYYEMRELEKLVRDNYPEGDIVDVSFSFKY